MSYAKLNTEAVKAACAAARKDIEDRRQARLQDLIKAEQASARRGLFGTRWLSRELSDEQALDSVRESGLDDAFDVALARNMLESDLKRIRRLHRLASETQEPTLWVSADDFNAIYHHYKRS